MKNSMQILAILLSAFLMNTCNKDEPKSPAKDIIGFNLAQEVGEPVINKTYHSILAFVTIESDLTKLAPEIFLSDGASSLPVSGDTVDFSKGAVKYIVTAEDKSTQEWNITVKLEDSDAAEILSFVVAGQTGDAIIGSDSVKLEMNSESKLDSIVPTIITSPGATITPSSGTLTDFSAGPVIYTVTSSSGIQKEWIVKLTRKPSVELSILSFTVPGQLGETVYSGMNITLEVPYTADLTQIAPEITISDYATISPASGEKVDFSSGKVLYQVTSEAGSKRTYSVYLNHVLIPADNENIHYTGRIDFTNPKEPTFWAPGVYIKAKYKGTSCTIAIKDEVLWGNSQNYIEIVIDDTNEYRVQTTGAINNILVGEGLSDGEHTILICKDTEAGIGYLKFLGFRCESLLPLPAKPERKIEFIGNSITCGAEADLSVVGCNIDPWYNRHNAYLSYGPRTARNLNAQWHLSSVSGIGMIHSCCGMTVVMKDVYENLGLNQNAKPWDFNNYIPDIVTISLGQNDGIQDSTAFCNAYVDFIAQIRSHYPDAEIICLTSPMADANLLSYMRNCLTGIVNYMNNAGDAKVHKLYFSKSYNNGCGGHPDLDDHKLIADELTAFIEANFGW